MIRNYFKIAFRNLWRHRNFSLLNIGGLTIGMTAGFLIFLYISYELGFDGFHSKGDRIYRVVTDLKTPSDENKWSFSSWAYAPHLYKEFPEIESTVRILPFGSIFQKGTTAFMEDGTIAADSTFFRIFDFKLLQGDQKTCLQKPFSIVLSQSTAKKYFGDQNPVGQTLEGTFFEKEYPVTVTGVMEDFPVNSHIQANIILSVSTIIENLDQKSDLDNQWINFNPFTYVLLGNEANFRTLEQKFPDFMERKIGEKMKAHKLSLTLKLEPFERIHLWTDRGAHDHDRGNINNIYIFGLIAIFTLLIACINFVNLTTARSVERAREVGVRKVIGAGKKQLRLQFIGESVIISLLALLITIGTTYLLLPYFNLLADKIIVPDFAFSLSHITILLCTALCIGILAGIYPAMVLSSYKPVKVLKGNFSTGSKGVLLRKTLVVFQFSISIALIIGTIVIYHQMHFMHNMDLGFKKDQILVLTPGFSSKNETLKQSMQNLPGVLSASLSSSVPGESNAIAYSSIENRTGDMQETSLTTYFIDFNFIKQFDLKIIAGRSLSPEFATDTTEAMLVNQKAVKAFGYDTPEDIIGKRFDQWEQQGRIVGVVNDFNFNSLRSDITPLAFRIEPKQYYDLALQVSTENLPQTIAAIETKWKQLFPKKPFDFFFMDEFLDKQYRSEERFGQLFLNFAVLAIIISCLGLLGLASYSVLQRRREIGIRKVVGASVPRIVNLLSGEFIWLVAIAFIVASPLIWLGMHYWLQNFAYHIAISWWIFAAGGGLALFIALATVSFHAVKAAMANPAKSLKTE
ncbi:FtsX-like permease family protein [Sinomicrobium sp. M5D2P9]